MANRVVIVVVSPECNEIGTNSGAGLAQIHLTYNYAHRGMLLWRFEAAESFLPGAVGFDGVKGQIESPEWGVYNSGYFHGKIASIADSTGIGHVAYLLAQKCPKWYREWFEAQFIEAEKRCKECLRLLSSHSLFFAENSDGGRTEIAVRRGVERQAE